MVMGYPGFEGDGLKHAKNYPPEELVPSAPVSLTPGLGGSKGKDVKEVSRFGIPWKSIIGFLTVFIGQLLARATVNGVPVLPENGSGWLALVGGSFGAAGLIWLKGNTYSVEQAQKKLDEAINRA